MIAIMYKPKTLLSTRNSKTVKGEKYGYTTYIMYLAPHKQNSLGKNLCSHASPGCAAACLFNSGAARFTPVQQGKINKTEYFLSDRAAFMQQLYEEISKIVSMHAAVTGDKLIGRTGKVVRHKKFAIRLNGTSDIPFENIKVIGDKNIFELFPNVQFYDYTKYPNRVNLSIPNYHVTFSRSETNHETAMNILKSGFNVAIVFGVQHEDELPEYYRGYKVINGDKSDLRFLDEENVIVGLKYKKLTGKGTAGVNKKHLDNNSFIVHPETEYKLKLVG